MDEILGYVLAGAAIVFVLFCIYEAAMAGHPPPGAE